MIYTAKDVVDVKAPPDLFESLIITPTEWEFGPSKKTKDPQLVVKWEVAGIKNATNGLDREMKRGDKVYIVAGLTLMSTYFTLTAKAMRFYRDFWCKANEKKEVEFMVDSENPDVKYLEKLYMSAVVKNVITDKTKPLTDEQKELLESQGMPLKNEVVTDDEGNVLKNSFLQVDTWNRRFRGDVPVF